MKITRYRLRIAAVLACGLAAGVSGFSQRAVTAEETCGEYGTSVEFAESPAAAAKQALKDEKLVFVLHVSGLFEEPEFT